MRSNCVIEWIEIYPVDSAIHLLNSLRAAEVFPVVASESAPRRLPFQQLGLDLFVVTHALGTYHTVTKTNFLSD